MEIQIGVFNIDVQLGATVEMGVEHCLNLNTMILGFMKVKNIPGE
jgi:hypothetical protein